jgi:hypothetical protein
MQSTSNKYNKIVCIYNYIFFVSMLEYIYNTHCAFVEDAAGIVWHVDDVVSILKNWKGETKYA